ncbi:ABC transporter substrate-binding protein [Poseidonibacter antarcticus]|uniref:ABC transporter substrate-binding protein n=1 Tax=Poseidonibacter antarcticus TaxID=2478538 RepID=UPI000EF53332|nr:ABC transporter substrate-binding protein [Poseidonibacter antarcticus]
MKQFLKYFFLFLLLNSYLFSSEDLKKIKLQLSWLNQFQFAGYYMAKQKGYYKEVGLDVEIIPYKMNMDIPSMVNNKEVDFAIGRENLILEILNKHQNLALLYATFQTSPLVFLTKKSSNINTIADFSGKRIMSTIEDSSEVSLKAMITSENVDFKSLKIIKHTHNINDFINNKTDIISAYTSKAPLYLDKKNIKYGVFNPKDYGFDIYSDFLYTNNELIQSDIQTVEKFKKASIRGWNYAYSNIEESADLIFEKYNNQHLTKEELIFEGKELKKLSFYKEIEFGNIDKNKIQRMYDLYKLMGLIKNNLDINNIIYKNSKSLFLTPKEKEYLANKKVLNICSPPNKLPYGNVENGNYTGITAELISLINKRLDVEMKIISNEKWIDSIFKIKSKECDIIPMIIKTKDRNKFMHFTSAYAEQSLVLATKDEEIFIDKLEKVTNKRIAVLKNTAFADILIEEYPKINLFYVNSPSEGLQKVNNSEVFAYADTLVSIAYSIRKGSFYNLKIAGKLKKEISFSMATRIDEKILNSIIEKTLNNISKKKKDDIFNNWISIHFSKEVDYGIIFNIISIFILLFISLFIFIYKQNKLKKEIEKLNKTLEERVKKEVENNRIKDITLFKQSKLASMGEMIRNIAHQWRQPLNRVNLSLSIIQTVYEEDDNKELITNKIFYAQKNIKYMSDTIDDFMNFFKADKKKNTFSIYTAIYESLKLLESRTVGIDINIIVPKAVEVYNYRNEYLQVLLIILNNALDNFKNTNLENKSIKIEYLERNSYFELFINDNGGGIAKENLENIFEPYFTTKFKKEGTGLGLYMAKTLVEDSMNGLLSVESEDNNTTFIIRLEK